MAISRSPEQMVQISFGNAKGGIFAPESVVRRYGLEVVRGETEPIPSFVPLRADQRNRRVLYGLEEINGEIIIPGVVVGFVNKIRETLTPPSLSHITRKLREFAANPGVVI